jgi:putative ABC transport system permease protein
MGASFARDVAYGGRLLLRSPGFALASIGIIALGIGATTAIFTIVYGVVLRPLPFDEPERLVNIWTRADRYGLARALVNVADYNDWRASNHVFEDIALTRNIANFNLTGEGEPERLLGARVTANVFPLLGVTPALGRTFLDEENEIGRDNVVLLSDGLWRRRLGADPSVIGRAISLSGVPHTVVGVMRPEFRYPSREFQIWTPITFDPREVSRKMPGYCCSAVARLAPGVSLEQAQSEMDAVARRLEVTYPDSNRQTGVEVVRMREDLVRGVRPALYMLLGAVACLVIIASLNLSTLLGARAAARTRELSVRMSLGASRGRLVFQAFAEVAPILVIGGVLGIVFARWAVSAFIPLAPATLPRVESLALNLPVLSLSLIVLGLAGLIAGLLPAVHARRVDLTSATREDSRSAAGGRAQSRARHALVVLQVALALPLLVGSGLLARSFSSLTQVQPGFDSQHAITMHLAIPRSKYHGDSAIAAICDRFLERVRGVPGLTSAGMVNRLPLAGVAQIGTLELEAGGRENVTLPSVDWRTATPDYFRAIGIPLIEGRTFAATDTDSAPLVGIVDERLARLVWPGQSPIGKRFRIPVPGSAIAFTVRAGDMPWATVIGVVGHIRHDGLDDEGRPQVYWGHLQRAQDRMVLVARTVGDPRAIAPSIIRALHDVDPEQPVYDVRSMEEVVERTLSQRWLNTALLAAFAMAALLLSSIGLYGVIAFGVTQRTREFGIRLALGADRLDITRHVVRQGAMLALVGAIIGLAMAALLTQGMRSLLYGIDSADLTSYAIATGVLIVVALVASYLPARRAATVDPATTLRAE